jgi:hypothetical protein
MTTVPDFPLDDSDTTKARDARSRLGRTIAVLGLFVATVPSCIVLYWLVQAFLALSGSPTTSYRPILGVYGLGLTILNAVACFPFPLLAERFGTKADGELALHGLYLIPLPFFLGLFGPFVVCWATGSSFGS